MNRRNFVLAAGATGAAALAGCVEDEEEDPTPPEEMDVPSTEPLGYMAEAFNYLNGHTDEAPEPSFDPNDLKDPYEGYVKSLQHLVEE